MTAGKELTETTRQLCAAYTALVASGGDVTPFIREWASLLNVQRPAIWRRLRSGGAIPPYRPREDGGRGRPQGGGEPGYSAARRAKALEYRIARREAADKAPRVDRDPCPRCGVRYDVGCKHHPRPTA